jgi:hypothetical protein
MELFQIEHKGRYPDLIGLGWNTLSRPSDAFGRLGQDLPLGPYLVQECAVSPFTVGSKVTSDTTGD